MGCSSSKNPTEDPVSGVTEKGAPVDFDDIKLEESTPFHCKYALKGVLGKGNYSVVKEGVNRQTGEQVAVKCITKANLTQEDEDALQIETAILKEMEHENIIKMFDFFEEKKMYYIVTEMMTGGELFDRIVEKEFYSKCHVAALLVPPPHTYSCADTGEKDAQQVVRTLAKALKYCHDKGVVHRDLKPENILLTSKDDSASIKIADFGFAKKLNTEPSAGGGPPAGLTTACGTPGYVAPEIINGQPYSKEVDMWSLGVIIYILLCGYPPFHDDNQAVLFSLIRKGQFEFDEPYWNSVSKDAMDLISGLLTVDATKRLTVDGILKHKWINSEASGKDITPALDQLRKFQARRRWKKGIGAVTATNRMKNLVAATKRAASQELDGGEASAPPPKAVD